MEALIAAVFIDTHGRFEEVARIFLPRILPRVGGGAGARLGVEGEDSAGDEGKGAEEERALRAADRARLEQAFPELWRLCDERFPSSAMEAVWTD
jgi:hypothetical protein